MARVEDLIRQTERHYEVAMGDFLSPAEAARVGVFLRTASTDAIPVFYGGYSGAERTRLLVLPSYMQPENGVSGDTLKAAFPEVADEAVSALRIEGSGFKVLSHRDYMGSVLGLGIERSVIGDIVTEGDFGALMFCVPSIVPYITGELRKIGSDSVKVTEVALPPDFRVERQFETVRDTIASARLDCIVAALAGLSREKAQNAIRGEQVEVDHLTESRVDRTVGEGSTVTVRHVGKFIIRSTEDVTRRGRYRLVADKYI